VHLAGASRARAESCVQRSRQVMAVRVWVAVPASGGASVGGCAGCALEHSLPAVEPPALAQRAHLVVVHPHTQRHHARRVSRCQSRVCIAPERRTRHAAQERARRQRESEGEVARAVARAEAWADSYAEARAAARAATGRPARTEVALRVEDRTLGVGARCGGLGWRERLDRRELCAQELVPARRVHMGSPHDMTACNEGPRSEWTQRMGTTKREPSRAVRDGCKWAV
jgi:hypothetical protein